MEENMYENENDKEEWITSGGGEDETGWEESE